MAVAHQRPDPKGLIAPGMELIGRWIQDARVRMGLTQAQLGRLTDLHQTTISRLERGRLEGLRLHRLAIVVAVLEHGLADLPIRRL